MLLLADAIIEIAKADAPVEWARYCELAPGIIQVPDAPRELLSRVRLGDPYDSTLRGLRGSVEYALETVFLERFVAAVQAGRCHVRGVPQGRVAVVNIPGELIADVRAFGGVKGADIWELGGTLWHVVRVVLEPPPSAEQPPTRPRLRSPSPNIPIATDEQIHHEIDAEYTDCENAGRPGWNLNEIRKPVQDRLCDKGLYATQKRIQQLAGDQKYASRRGPPGPHRRQG
jgi:hypothetical protein